MKREYSQRPKTNSCELFNCIDKAKPKRDRVQLGYTYTCILPADRPLVALAVDMQFSLCITQLHHTEMWIIDENVKDLSEKELRAMQYEIG